MNDLSGWKKKFCKVGVEELWITMKECGLLD